MISPKVPWLVLAGITAGFIGVVIATADSLPLHVATHFDVRGGANGWMGRSAYIGLVSGLGFGESLLVALLAYCTRYLPNSTLKSAARGDERSLSASERGATNRFIAEFGAWLACVGCLFALGLHLVILAANRVDPPAMPGLEFALFLCAFFALLGVWIFALIRRLRRGAV